MKKPQFLESGQAIVMIVFLMMVMLGIGALAIDGGRVYSERRQVQNVADSSVMSGALEICNDGSAGDVIAAVQATAAANGYTTGVTVQYPMTDEPYAGEEGYVKVVITSEISSGFAGLVFPDDLQNTVHAIALCQQAEAQDSFLSETSIISLNEHDKKSVVFTGNANVDVDGGVFANSDNVHAMKVIGNADAAADWFHVVGGWMIFGGNGTFTPTPVSGFPPITDPIYSNVDPPEKPEGTCTSISWTSDNDLTLDPGLYCKISVSGNGDVYLNPGNYWIETGEFKVSGNGDVIGDDVMIYMGPNAGKIQIVGNGALRLTGRTSSERYWGFVIWVDYGNTSSVQIDGNGSTCDFSGTIYAPSSDVTVTGNGSATTTFNTQIIADKVEVVGNGNVEITFDTTKLFQLTGASTVSLIE